MVQFCMEYESILERFRKLLFHIASWKIFPQIKNWEIFFQLKKRRNYQVYFFIFSIHRAASKCIFNYFLSGHRDGHNVINSFVQYRCNVLRQSNCRQFGRIRCERSRSDCGLCETGLSTISRFIARERRGEARRFRPSRPPAPVAITVDSRQISAAFA